MLLAFIIFAVFSLSAHCSTLKSFDDLTIWNVFTRLDYPNMLAFVMAQPGLLQDPSIRALLRRRGVFVSAFVQNPNPLLFHAIPTHIQVHLIRRAAIQGKERTVRDLIHLGVDSKWLDYPLRRAIRLREHTEWIRALMPPEKHITMIKANKSIDVEYLMEACSQGRVKDVKELISKGVDVNAVIDESTPLIKAIIGGHDEIVRSLIDAGADVDFADSIKGNTALIVAVEQRRANIVHMLLTAGANLNARNKLGNTALVQAVKRGLSDASMALIAAGANVNIKNNYGNTALIWAVGSGDLETVQTLIAMGADVNARNGKKETALMNARSVEIARELLDAGADIHAKDSAQKTALYYAKKRQNSELVKLLETVQQ